MTDNQQQEREAFAKLDDYLKRTKHQGDIAGVGNAFIGGWQAARSLPTPSASLDGAVVPVRGVCSNKTRSPTQNNHSKGSQYRARDVRHIRKSGAQTMCGADSSEWLDMGLLEIDSDTCAKCCAQADKLMLQSREPALPLAAMPAPKVDAGKIAECLRQIRNDYRDKSNPDGIEKLVEYGLSLFNSPPLSALPPEAWGGFIYGSLPKLPGEYEAIFMAHNRGMRHDAERMTWTGEDWKFDDEIAEGIVIAYRALSASAVPEKGE